MIILLSLSFAPSFARKGGGHRPAPGGAVSSHAFFVATTGNDAGGRGSEQDPWRTIGYALRQLKPGDTLNVRGGVYYEHGVDVRLNGTAQRPIVIQGYPGENAVMDGGFPEFREAGNQDWEIFDQNIGEWRSKAAVNKDSDKQRVYGFILGVPRYANERVRLITYERAEDLRSNNERHDADEDDGAALYVGPGVWRDPGSGRIHIRLMNNAASIPAVQDPRQLSLHLSTAESILDFSGSSYLTVRNLTLQNAQRAILLEGVNHHLVFDAITTWANSGIFVPMAMSTLSRPLENSFITVVRSKIFNDHPAWLYWSDVKRPPDAAHTLESGAIAMRSNSHDWEIAWNHFRGGFDGPSQGRNSHDIRYHNNLVEAYADDAFELEGDCAHVEVYENYIRHTFSGVAMSPCLKGPVYIYRNVIANLDEYPFRRPNIEMYGSKSREQIGYPFKFTEYAKSGAHPEVAVYQNTIVYLGREGKKDRGLAWVNHQSPNGFKAFNNIGYVVNGVAAAGYGDPNQGQQIDGNLYFKANGSDGAKLLSDIEGKRFASLAAFRESKIFTQSKESYPAGWESNGQECDPQFAGFTPKWVHSSSYWKAATPFFAWPVEAFSLVANSPARQAGVALPATLPDTRRPAAGTRPDGGAIPFGEKLTFGPDAKS